MTGPDPSLGPGLSALHIRPFPRALIICGEEEPVPTHWPHPRPLVPALTAMVRLPCRLWMAA